MEILRIDFASELGREAARLRVRVFVEEQGVPAEMEIDEYDAGATHFVAVEEGIVVGTLRVVDYVREGRRVAKIGRVAVEAGRRGRGIGRELMRVALEGARGEGFGECFLTAQVVVIGFYEGLGFAAEGPVFDDCGIPHRAMRLLIEPK